jgi:hypothetical protein
VKYHGVVPTEADIRKLKARVAGSLLKRPGVSGVGIQQDDSGNPVLAVYLDDPTAKAILQPEFSGEPIVFEYTGKLLKQ